MVPRRESVKCMPDQVARREERRRHTVVCRGATSEYGLRWRAVDARSRGNMNIPGQNAAGGLFQHPVNGSRLWEKIIEPAQVGPWSQPVMSAFVLFWANCHMARALLTLTTGMQRTTTRPQDRATTRPPSGAFSLPQLGDRLSTESVRAGVSCCRR